MDQVADIKSRISIEDLVAQYIPLKKSGRQFKALCPFHKERTPSFYVSPERGMAYCFGCRKGGDHFAFIQEIEGLDFRGALQFLAEKAGVQLAPLPKEARQAKSQRDRLIEIHEHAVRFFEQQLHEIDEGEKIQSYIKERGLSEETVRSARLGFAPAKGNALYTYLLERDFTRDEIVASGLAFARDTEQGSMLDRFRNRLIFPITNLTGQVCAFGGRAIEKGDEPKYLNSPETPIYHKSAILYGLSQARPAIRETNKVIIVEGYMDALSSAQAGYHNVVACSGTALTELQLRTLKRFTNHVILALDRDSAGKLATLRSLELGLTEELSLAVAVWDGPAKDPDDCIRQSPEVFEASIKNPQDVFAYLLSAFEAQYGTQSPTAKKEIVEALLPFFTHVKSPMLLDAWMKECTNRLGVSPSALYDEFKRYTGKQKRVATPAKFAPAPTGQESQSIQNQLSLDEYFLGLLLTYKEAYSLVFQLISINDFSDSELQNIYRFITTQYNPSSVKHILSPSEENRANILTIAVESTTAEMPWAATKNEILEALSGILKRRFEREKREIVTRMKSVSPAEKQELLNTYQHLLAESEKIIEAASPTYGQEN